MLVSLDFMNKKDREKVEASLRDRKMPRERALAQFLLHMRGDPDCHTVFETSVIPTGFEQAEPEVIPLTRFAAAAGCGGGMWYVLAAGEGEYESTWIWARFRRSV